MSFSSSRSLTRLSRFGLVAALLVTLMAFPGPSSASPGTKPITFADLMKFRAIANPVISEDGTVVAYGAQPDRGDGEGIIHVLASGKVIKVPRGSQPAVSIDGRFVTMVVKPAFAVTEKAGKDKPKPGLALVNVSTGAVVNVADVDKSALSADGKWLAYLLSADAGAAKPGAKPAPAATPAKPAVAERKPGGMLRLRNLATGAETPIPLVTGFAFDPASKHIAYVVADRLWKGNGLFVRPLDGASANPIRVAADPDGKYEPLAWTKDGRRLAALSAIEKDGKPGAATVWVWDATARQSRKAVAAEALPAGWIVPFKNGLDWSDDGARLFVGLKPAPPERKSGAKPAAKGAPADPDPYDFSAILSKVELDVWHSQDPRIVPQQKIQWDREKDRTYRAVLHVETGKLIQLATLDLPDVDVPDNAKVALATTALPYQRQATWDEGYRDVYVVDLATGARKPIVSKLNERAMLAPDGRTVVFFKDRAWHAYECAKGTTTSLTASIEVSLVDESHDTPDQAPPHGFGGWVDQGASVLVYDRYDIWQIPATGGTPMNITAGQGRRQQVTFRTVATDPDAKSFAARQPILLTAYHEREKNFGFYQARPGAAGVELRLDEKKRFRFVARAKKADANVYTRESYEEFPDLWVADSSFKQPKKITDANPQLAEFAWGAAELVEYASADGVPLQGVLIKPANYQPGKRYPVITYFYERQSQRLYEFNEPVVNHRPSFAVYAGAGYAVFLPDVVFEIGHPGQSMLKCVVPAVQKLVDMGLADPKALGLHGHSWGGYGTAYLVTQTNMFKAAVAGAPVANMTSAYGGIRWESGLARQFQYEKTQSRIGGSLWEFPLQFLENSALFYSDRVTTPLLIEHGDEDGAVPWYQSIEYYLALRRLDKDVIFLQYRGEPHHLKKYPNKLDYSIKMKEYFDHYLKGEPAAEWIAKGVPYQGK